MAASGRQAGSGPTSTQRGRGLGPTAALCIITLALVCLLSATGQGPVLAPISGIIAAIATGLQAGLFALAYVLGAIGLGRLPAAFLARELPSRLWVQAALGIALMLYLSHLLGCFGLLSGESLFPRVVAWGVVAIGIGLLTHQLPGGDFARDRWPTLPWLALLGAPALAVLFVAAANAPGWLWQSEFGAYDALSYHLQLPKEWAAGNRLAPVDHNVYSYLPGYIEAAYLHLAQMTVGGGGGGRGGGGTTGSGSGSMGLMISADGAWVYSCQSLHALLGLVAAALTGRGVWVVARKAGAPDGSASVAGWVAGLVLLGTGWTLVCASLAYNEMGVLVCTAGAMLLCVDRPPPAAADDSRGAGSLFRAVGIGFFVGIATSCKPTALLLIGPATGIMMLGMFPRRIWATAVLAGTVGGLLAITPWLVRNAIAAGNPVFPFGAGLLGMGHWTAEQTARYARAHTYSGSLVDRLSLLISARGWLHPQWGVTPWVALGAATLALVRARSRRIALLLIAGIVCGLAAWLFLTHLQSRFLLPLIVPMTLLIGAAAGGMGGTGTTEDRDPRPRPHTLVRRVAIWALIAALGLTPGLLSLLGFATQNGGAPNAVLIGGVGEFTGMTRVQSVYRDLPPGERAVLLRGSAPPFELMNLAVQPAVLGGDARAALLGLEKDLPPGEPSAVYLLGDAAPLYYLGASGGRSPSVVYHTTWDRSIFGNAIRADSKEHGSADGPGAWTDFLRARGIGFVLVNHSELKRLIDKDHNFDPDVTTTRVERWLTDPASRLRVVRAWTFHSGGDEVNNPAPGGEWTGRDGLVLVQLLGATEPTGEGAR